MRPIYLDYNATTPIDYRVASEMGPYLYTHFGNPSSVHPFGLATKEAVETARQQVAELLGCMPGEIVFTSGGTESNNHAIRGIAFSNQQRGSHIVTSQIEHPAVTEVCHWLETQGFSITEVPVDESGRVDPDDVRKAITDKTILISIMLANNEVGTLQPVREIADLAHQHDIFMHTDSAQAVGKVPVRVKELEVDLLSVAGHKLYAPKGIGVLYIRNGVELEPLMYGASHESGRRPGTENVLEIVGLGAACRVAREDLEHDTTHLTKLRDRLHQGLVEKLGEDVVRLNGHFLERLPNTLSLSFYNIEANSLLLQIHDQVAASAGAACHADRIEISRILKAMKVPVEWAKGTIRFSVGRFTTLDEIEKAVEVISLAVKKLST